MITELQRKLILQDEQKTCREDKVKVNQPLEILKVKDLAYKIHNF